MRLRCDIVMDLMGLYADGAASEDTVQAVEEHLAECPMCRQFYKQYRQTPPAAQEQLYDGAMDYSVLAKRIRTRRLWTYAGMLSYISVSICMAGVLLYKKWMREK